MANRKSAALAASEIWFCRYWGNPSCFRDLVNRIPLDMIVGKNMNVPFLGQNEVFLFVLRLSPLPIDETL